MSRYNASLVYPRDKFHLILQSSFRSNEFYGLDDLERRKLNIIQAKYGCKHRFHTLPDQVSLYLNKFYWKNSKECFEIDLKHKEHVQLNTLEEAIVDYIKDDYFQYLFW